MADNVAPLLPHICHHLLNPLLALLASSSTMPRRVMARNNPSHNAPTTPPRPPCGYPQNYQPYSPRLWTSPMSGNMMSPTTRGGYVRRAAPEPNKRALYRRGNWIPE